VYHGDGAGKQEDKNEMYSGEDVLLTFSMAHPVCVAFDQLNIS